MVKATLIWVSRSGDATRVFRVPRAAILGLVGASGGLLLAFLGMLWWGTDLHDKWQQERAAVLSLERSLVSQAQALDEQQTVVHSARQQRQTLEAEVLRLQGVDVKIRRLLGLNAPDFDASTAHQGGVGPGELEAEAADPALAESATVAAVPLRQPDAVQNSLQEVLAYLEERRDTARSYPMLLPVSAPEAWLSCAFGRRNNPFAPEKSEFHNGVDIAGPWKDPILAPADGRVIRTGKDRLLGNYVKLEHSAEIKTLYGHLATVSVASGDQVKRGDQIGTMGNTGRSTGNHLHYSVSVAGKYVDPLDYIWDRPFHRLNL